MHIEVNIWIPTTLSCQARYTREVLIQAPRFDSARHYITGERHAENQAASALEVNLEQN